MMIRDQVRRSSSKEGKKCHFVLASSPVVLVSEGADEKKDIMLSFDEEQTCTIYLSN
jgi:hypothetical protein